MNIEDYRNYCLSKKGVTEGFPFDKTTLVFKVMGKMFSLANIDAFTFINLKCNPEKAIELREKYEAVKPGYHMNKALWNSVYVNLDVTDKLIYTWTDDSYNLIVQSLTKKLRLELESL
jgi:predicted DNA-binding protein (MmcQ/YjbR family)